MGVVQGCCWAGVVLRGALCVCGLKWYAAVLCCSVARLMGVGRGRAVCWRKVWLTCVTSPRSLKEKALFILQATFQHARNLAFFTAVYRTLMAVLAWSEGRASQWHTFVAAFTSGYFVFGREDKVNTQVRPAAELLADGGVNFKLQFGVSQLSMHFSSHSSLNDNCTQPHSLYSHSTHSPHTPTASLTPQHCFPHTNTHSPHTLTPTPLTPLHPLPSHPYTHSPHTLTPTPLTP